MTEPDNRSHYNGKTEKTYVELAIKLVVLGALLYWSLLLVRPFIPIVIWSVILAVALYPLFQWTARKLGGRETLAAFLVTTLTLLVVIGPATWFALDLIESVRILSERVNWQDLVVPAPDIRVKSWPILGEDIYRLWTLAATNTREAFAKIYPYLKPLGGTLLQVAAGTGTGIIKFLVSVIVAGFLFVSAPTLVGGIKKLALKLETERGEYFIALAGATIRTVCQGVIGIAVLQALLAGIGLTLAGIPAASLLTFAILILGIIQVGPSIVIIPLIIWSWFSMETSTAALFTAYMLPVNLIDNILRPFLLGRGLETPMLVVLVGVIGGTISHGITGLFLGPIILAVIWQLLVAWIDERADGSTNVNMKDLVQ
jgi:predicted PurR-regulated permease PerM